MAAASYDQLLRQVEVLKMENTTLRQELQDNSNHLTHLESEAENMKEVLKQLQGTIEEESGEASGSQLELIERLKEMSLDSSGFKPRAKPPGASGGAGGSALPRRGAPPAGREQERCLEELEKERKQHYVHNGHLNWDKSSTSDDYIRKHLKPLKNYMHDQTEEDFFDLLGSMLEYDVYRRITLEEALWHPFFNPLRMQKQ